MIMFEGLKFLIGRLAEEKPRSASFLFMQPVPSTDFLQKKEGRSKILQERDISQAQKNNQVATFNKVIKKGK